MIAPLNVAGDRNPSSFKDGEVTTPPGWKEAYRDWAAAGWNGLAAPAEELKQGFMDSAGVEVCKGFAVGRTIFGEPSRKWLRGDYDDEQLIQAVLNIVHNAAQALSERIANGDAQIVLRTRVARQVTIAKRLYKLALDLHVIDNGPGIPEDIRERIFYPLVSGRDGGSGLGLSIVRTLVTTELDGTIEMRAGDPDDFRAVGLGERPKGAGTVVDLSVPV